MNASAEVGVDRGKCVEFARKIDATAVRAASNRWNIFVWKAKGVDKHV
jgi:hypothetical protein